MADFGLEAFWAEDRVAHRENCFFPAEQVALGIRMSDECVYAELGEAGHPWVPEPMARRAELNCRYNDKAEKIVGVRLLSEEYRPTDSAFPYVKRIGEAFGGTYQIINHSEWLERSIFDREQLVEALARVEQMDFRAFMLPPNWAAEKQRIYEAYGLRPQPLRHIRGPVTLACSLMGAQEFLFLLLDEPELADRFSRAISGAALKMARVMDEEAGVTALSHRGFSFADDNCCLLNPELYERFGFPVLKRLFDHYSPDPDDPRYQHSDSAMGHLLPILGRLDLTGVNFGPTVLIPEIRRHLPRARIDGCIDPMAFMRNDREALIRQVRRDCREGMRHGGVNISTAGSINDGSSLESLRLIMETIWDERRGG